MSFFEWFRFFRISSFLHGEKALPLLAVQECGTVLWLSVGLWGLWWVDCEGRQSAASGACGASLTDCPAPVCFVVDGLLGARSAHGITGASCVVVGLRLKAGHGEAGLEPAAERYRGGPTFSRRRGRLSEGSPCRYSGRAICRFYVSDGLPLSACLWKRRAGAARSFCLQKA